MLSRLAAMLPDETLRLSRSIFPDELCATGRGADCLRAFSPNSLLDEPPELLHQLLNTAVSQPWFYMVFVLAFMLIPLSMTMSLLWKTKESILASVFHSPH
ncbi:MAG: hypothetical protein Ct9H300mP7_2430 [Verrucomicrobiota bacterium]|nr:MAG: hypothetical protein Ct9H300mP7_2430 [Verrucomicrobiota bacterium]